MKKIFPHRSVALLVILVATASLHAQNSGDYVGTWQVDLGVTYSNNDSYRRVDRATVERTTTTTLGTGARGMGTLQINADGTYRLEYSEYEMIYRKPVIIGKWRAVRDGEIYGEVNIIELIDAKPDMKYEANDRKWYVFRKQDGSVEARYPPYDGYAKIKLTRAGKSAATGSRAKVTNSNSAASPSTRNSSGRGIIAPSGQAAAPKTRTWTPDEVRKHLEGKTKEEVISILGRPVKVAYGTYSFNGVAEKFPPCPNGCNWKSFAIQFGNSGGTVSSVELQYWVVE